jgi:[ribosomal protein S5]-alanine N-acetyltransferase
MQRPEIPRVPGLPTLKTPRLLLRELTLADAPDMFAYASDPEVARTSTWEAHTSLEDTRAFIRFARNHYAAGEPGPWGLAERASGRVLGTCSLALAAHHFRAELGYALARAHWGQGLTTEAAAAVVAYGFRTLGLRRIEARCRADNLASERVMQKLGMTYEGTLRECMFIKGEFVTTKVYSLLRAEWDALSAS